NAERHDGVAAVTLRAAPGPSLYVEWPAPAPASVRVRSGRHPLQRRGWGWGYVRMVADALGGSALPPGPTRPGWIGASLGLGANRLCLPLACTVAGTVRASTLAWDEGEGAPLPGEGLPSELSRLAASAGRAPGRIVYLDVYRARAAGDRVWLVLGPESGSARLQDLLHGLAHERLLWTAPEPHATRLQALATLLAALLGTRLPAVPPSVWEEGFGPACAALGLGPPAVPAGAFVLPDPRLAAFLLAEAGGCLMLAEGELRLAAGRLSHPLLARLGRDASGLARLTG
ncbi:MAG: hypothetical protein M3024_10635, partial [Candidatus Dormibacteraeota bacterium]|nr:hypothetical protein [Candidatus Dormibacteraeota bacterium]